MIIGHGGNKQGLADQIGCQVSEIVDMSSNLNPLGPPQIVEKTINANLDKIRSLPEPDAMGMKKGFADFHGLDPEQVVAGNGTTFFIYTIPRAFNSEKILIAGPTYSDYRDAALMAKAEFKHVYSNDSDMFVPDVDSISENAGRADTVFICNPNNPTGVLIQKDQIEFLLKKHSDTVFIIDESYLPFVDKADEISMVTETGYENLVVLSSMSKIFQIPGLRTGFLSAAAPLAEKIMDYYQPWSVNSLAQEVIKAIFSTPEIIEPFYKQTRDFIKKEKQIFLDQLKGFDAILPFETSTYFILARLKGELSSKQFCQLVGKEKLLIRDCSNFDGLTDEYVRFSLKEREINTRLAHRIQEVLR